ncbi:DUF1800 domain-containing protein [Flaviaesturariibacter amylovorans]|uniref:DUF1800 domain-containing protein n=1 Tax=Flaviaesturariibacter amylovorans TaxID=1084520 RepID=A0ABP8G9X8_9BACT
MPTNDQKCRHLLWRAGFGPSADSLADSAAQQPGALYAALRAASAARPAYINVIDESLRRLVADRAEAGRLQAPDTRRMLREKSREGIRALNLTWLYQLIESPAQLREKMAFFWHGHFAARNQNVLHQQGLLDLLRVNALGSFRTLLHEVSKSGAMLQFLNAQQNRKDHPNENFAREVMELFTMGRGHYTERDIKEAARAFTGWGANYRGDFQFRRAAHDDGSKTVFGKTGAFVGEDVLNMLLEQKQTARHIAGKLYRFFVHETPDATHVAWLADRFYKNDYDIQKLLDDLFTADWFYAEKNIGTRIKSPVELIAGIQRLLPMKLQNEEALLLVQRLLGQVLFYPPNVAGWPGGRSWIDSSTLMTRMRIPLLLQDGDGLDLRPKDDDDTNGGQMEGGGRAGRPISAQIEWTRFTRHFDAVPRAELMDRLTRTVLQVPLRVPAASVSAFADGSARDAFVRTATLRLMALPEYQLC